MERVLTIMGHYKLRASLVWKKLNHFLELMLRTLLKTTLSMTMITCTRKK